MTPRRTHGRPAEAGFALVIVMLMSAMLAALLGAYFLFTRVELVTTRSSMDSSRGFYAAEAGLNLRAEGIRDIFLDYNRPAGAGPNELDGNVPCASGNDGTGDFSCVVFPFEERDVTTWVREDPANPIPIVVPPGETFQNLSAQEYRYNVQSVATAAGRTEAILEMQFESRLIPLFQFAAFYNKDLEILPGPDMTLAGPVYANGELYLDADPDGVLTIQSQVATTGSVNRGRKDADSCGLGDVQVFDPSAPRSLPSCGPGRVVVAAPDLISWNGMIRTGVEPVTVPAPESLDPVPGALFWDRADVRIALVLDSGGSSIEVRHADGLTDSFGSDQLDDCAAAAHTDTFYNHREDDDIEMLDVDMAMLLDCLHANPLLLGGKALDDTTDGGLVVYLTVDGPQSSGLNSYGVRVHNGAELASGIAGAPDIRGLTVVTDQALYVWGDYNATDKKPAAFLADSLNILSNGWDDDDDSQDLYHPERSAFSTTIQAAFLAGTDSTGFDSDDEDSDDGDEDTGDYNGGLENYPRLHERWTDRTLTYRGSFVSLNRPRHVDGPWSTSGVYKPPVRDWAYDVDFNDAANLPPLTPRVVYLKQRFFERRFGL